MPRSDKDVNKDNHDLLWMEKDLTHIFTLYQFHWRAREGGFPGCTIMVKDKSPRLTWVFNCQQDKIDYVADLIHDDTIPQIFVYLFFDYHY